MLLDIIAENRDLSFCWRKKTIKDTHYRCLAGAVWPEETETLAGDDGKVDPVDGPESVIVFRQIFGGDDLHGRLLIKIAEKKVRRNRTPCQIAQDEGKHVS
jgi:hypothetical protein